MLWDESARVPVLADHSSIVIKSLRMRSTDLNERVQVNHSFIVDMPEVSVSPRTGGSVRIPNSLRILFWICGFFASSRKAKVNVLAVVSSEEIDWSGNVMCVGPVTAYVQQE